MKFVIGRNQDNTKQRINKYIKEKKKNITISKYTAKNMDKT